MTIVPSDTATILVVDDDPGHCELVRRNLRRAGVRNPLRMLHSGDAALAYLKTRDNHADGSAAELLMLLDINMPGGMTGLDVLRAVKSEAGTRRLPVIVLTTASDPDDISRCYELGCNVYLTKPIDARSFTDAIHRLGLFIAIASFPRQQILEPQ